MARKPRSFSGQNKEQLGRKFATARKRGATIADACRECGISESTARNWRKSDSNWGGSGWDKRAGTPASSKTGKTAGTPASSRTGKSSGTGKSG